MSLTKSLRLNIDTLAALQLYAPCESSFAVHHIGDRIEVTTSGKLTRAQALELVALIHDAVDEIGGTP